MGQILGPVGSFGYQSLMRMVDSGIEDIPCREIYRISSLIIFSITPHLKPMDVANTVE
jgi:hypothetical protein